jgi:8-oxo-dGTP pyrophosphatase MutT (NUDIX family)
MHQIRPLAICAFQRNNHILVAEGHDPVKNQQFYRPLGGGIEFGERSEDTIRRELKEEIDADVAELYYVGTLENIFTFNGIPGHEIVMVYDGTLIESRLYEQTLIVGKEVDIDQAFNIVWKSLAEFESGASILYPTGLVELLRDNKSFRNTFEVLHTPPRD